MGTTTLANSLQQKKALSTKMQQQQPVSPFNQPEAMNCTVFF